MKMFALKYRQKGADKLEIAPTREDLLEFARIRRLSNYAIIEVVETEWAVYYRNYDEQLKLSTYQRIDKIGNLSLTKQAATRWLMTLSSEAFIAPADMELSVSDVLFCFQYNLAAVSGGWQVHSEHLHRVSWALQKQDSALAASVLQCAEFLRLRGLCEKSTKESSF